MKTFLVNYYVGSYQYKEPTMHKVSEVYYEQEMKELRNEIFESLSQNKAGSTPAASKDAFWATFCEFDGNHWSENHDIERVIIEQ